MKYYSKLIELGCFSRSEMETLTGSKAAAHSLIYDYMGKGYIERVRHNFYATISLETKQPICNRYQIASKMFVDAIISHHSAFEYYGYANQVFYEVYVTTQSRFKSFEYNGITYKQLAPRCHGEVNHINDVSVTSLERTIVDSINDLEHIAGLEELLRCLFLVPSVDSGKILKILAEYDNGFLYQKTGYILEQFKTTLHLPDKFFTTCSHHTSESKKYLTKFHKDYVLQQKWNLYTPTNLTSLISKGAITDAAVYQNNFRQKSKGIRIR